MSENPSPIPPSPAQNLGDAARQCLLRSLHHCELQIRKAPVTTVLGALAAGYLLRRLPLRAMLVTQARMLAAVISPTLMACAAAELYKLWQHPNDKPVHPDQL